MLLGGTMHVATEDRAWLHGLRGWLKDYRATGRPLLAICGGHQMLATQLGGGELAGRSGGTLAGTYEVLLSDRGRSHPIFSGLPEKPRFRFANYLHVVPSVDQEPGALATQPNSPAIALDHGGNRFSCQFHPGHGRSLGIATTAFWTRATSAPSRPLTTGRCYCPTSSNTAPSDPQ